VQGLFSILSILATREKGGRREGEGEKGERREAGRIGTRGRVGRSDGIKQDSNGTDTFFHCGISIRKVNRDLLFRRINSLH